jgi:ATP adenylyltransferase
MKRLWAAWRIKYMTNEAKETGCIFCNALAKSDDLDNLIVMRTGRAFVILNKFPYTSGHIMIAPLTHTASIEELDPTTRAELMELASRGMATLRKVYAPHAFNMGANIGEAAGAGVPGHVHFHIVPRWLGDTNFMTSVADIRVMPENLESAYRKIKAAWE